jgi:diguanylate cyclase (GGDEF)-like protein
MGYDAEELLGLSGLSLVHPDDMPHIERVFGGLSPERPQDQAVWRLRRPDGSYQWMETHYRRLTTGHIVTSIRNVQRRKEAEEYLEDALARVERLAMRDTLTDLANRRCFIEMVERTLATASRYALLLLDLDRFKPINDVYGHAAGDHVLVEIATRLARAVPNNTPLARLGGDEFAILVNDEAPGSLVDLIQDLLRTVAEPIAHAGRFVDTGASIGVARTPRDGQDCSTLLRRADLAMYEAKQNSRGAFRAGSFRMFEPGMDQRVLRATELRSALPTAIHTGQIRPHYQPVVSLDDGRILAFEALARWYHPTKGVLSPDQFIQASEELRMQPELFGSILTHACRDARDWPATIQLHVNVSPIQLADPDMPQQIMDILALAGFDPARLVLEIVETLPTEDTPMAAAVMTVLQSNGIRVLLDDFGIGHSGLHTLQQLQVDGFKIDRSFVEPVATNPAAERYLTAILEFARALDLDVTAEGIETEPVLARLRAMGCTRGQGYLFSRPIPAEDVPALIDGWSQRNKADPGPDHHHPQPAHRPPSRRSTLGNAGPGSRSRPEVGSALHLEPSCPGATPTA